MSVKTRLKREVRLVSVTIDGPSPPVKPPYKRKAWEASWLVLEYRDGTLFEVTANAPGHDGSWRQIDLPDLPEWIAEIAEQYK